MAPRLLIQRGMGLFGDALWVLRNVENPFAACEVLGGVADRLQDRELTAEPHVLGSRNSGLGLTVTRDDVTNTPVGVSGQVGYESHDDVVDDDGHRLGGSDTREGGDFSLGVVRDEHGNNSAGLHAGVHLLQLRNNTPNGGGTRELDGPSASIDATMDQDTATLGVQTNAISLAGGAHDNEHGGRTGIGLGEGAQIRAHYGDADHDGTRSMGFGLDVGPLSFDVQSEALGRVSRFLSSDPQPPQPQQPPQHRGTTPTAADQDRVAREAASVPAARQIAATTPSSLRQCDPERRAAANVCAAPYAE